MLIVECVPELVADAMRFANGLFDIAMRVSIDPEINSALLYVVGQFDGESAIDFASLKLLRHKLIWRNMMRDDNLIFCITLRNGLLDKLQASPVFPIEVGESKHLFAIKNTSKIAHALLGDVSILQVWQLHQQEVVRLL